MSLRTEQVALLVALLLAVCTMLGGCHGETPPPDAAGDVSQLDAAVCDGPLELGRCALADEGRCLGYGTEVPRFAPVPEGGPIPVVIGHQGSSMLALAARTRGILPGDPAQPPAFRGNPIIEVVVLSEERSLVALYRGRVAFYTDPDDPDLFWQPSLFVIVDRVLDQLAGPLTAIATVRDSAGATRCGSMTFTVAPP